MVKVSLTIEGDAEEVIAAIRKLAGSDAESVTSVSETVDDDVPDATPESTTASNVSSPAAPPVPEGRWTIDHVRTFWRYLAPNAQQVYHQVAHSNGYVMSRQSLLDAMGLTERQLSGRMSSVGHSVRRIRNVHNVSLPHPMTFDQSSDDYKMLPDVADAIVRLNLAPSTSET
jgi:hypothetical protein